MKNVISLLKSLQADSTVLFMKLHNFHWNVKGMDFHPVHAATEEMYDGFADLLDDLAERVLQLGDKPLVTLKAILASARIKEEEATSFTSKAIAEAVLKDYEFLVAEFKNLSKLADEAGDKVTASFADDNVAKFEKSIWMLKAQLG
ncbi:MAG: Dps family protein [Wolinella sp.]